MSNVLITGSSSGFGRMTTISLLERGATVFATMRDAEGRNAEKAAALRDEAAALDGTLHILSLDVASDDSVKTAIDSALATAGHLDVVINNAGYGVGGMTEGFTPDQIRDLFEVNVIGVHRVNRAVLPSMRARGAGLLVHISSTMGRMVLPFAGPYTASKYALEGLAESLRYELSQTGVDVVIVEPGGFGTNFLGAMVPPADEAVIESYGALNEYPQQMWGGVAEAFASGQGPDPQMVIDAILGVIETPAGERPLRTVVDGMGFAAGPEAINQTSDGVQQQTLEGMGVAALLKLRAAE
jgi:NAD(P)-dependent dehydrogenase (short-subunit alcohol dehydrogenase family)